MEDDLVILAAQAEFHSDAWRDKVARAAIDWLDAGKPPDRFPDSCVSGEFVEQVRWLGPNERRVFALDKRTFNRLRKALPDAQRREAARIFEFVRANRAPHGARPVASV